MNVEAPQTKCLEYPFRQDEPVSGHHHHICTGGLQRLLGGRRILGVLALQLESLGLGDRYALLQCELLDRRGLQLHAAPGGAVGLGQHQHHLVTSLHQTF